MAHPVLEQFVRDYVESIGGVWDEVEPQVYDLLLPADSPLAASAPAASPVVRLTFDPEALPEHPSAQLASFGTPLVDSLIGDALRRGSFQCLYFLGLNLAPHDLAGKARRAFSLPPDTDFRVLRARSMHFPQAFFWFESTFISDQKENELLSVAMDLHYSRQMRHHEKLLDPTRLADRPAQSLPEAPHIPLARAVPLARQEVLRTLGPMIHLRNRELTERLDRQVARMRRYYADLASEADASATRAKDNEEAKARIASRRQALLREEALRIAELRQKNTLRVTVRQLITLLIYQPKILLALSLSLPKKPPLELSAVWDPLVEAIEAIPCPTCRTPTYTLTHDRLAGMGCPACQGKK